MEHLVAAENLSKHYGDVVALNDVSFGISDGITGILGENGAGKSTAFRSTFSMTKENGHRNRVPRRG